MRRFTIALFIVALTMAVFVAGGYAATRAYQFTGVVKAADAGSMTVEKSAKETWQFELSKDTKGTAKVGAKGAGMYKTMATDGDVKPGAATPGPKKK